MEMLNHILLYCWEHSPLLSSYILYMGVFGFLAWSGKFLSSQIMLALGALAGVIALYLIFTAWALPALGIWGLLICSSPFIFLIGLAVADSL